MKSDIRDVMSQWARWRKGRIGTGLYWPSKSTLGKAMEGMPGTICPTCRGKDEDCAICYGTGRVRLDPGGKKINPAFVPSTYRGTDDDTSALVDKLMCDLRRSDKTLKFFLVLWFEFVRQNGTQEIKAQQIRMSHRINLTPGNYRILLYRGLALIERGLEPVTNCNVYERHGV